MKGSVVNGNLVFDGKITVSGVMPMNLEFEIALTRCNLDMSGCVFFDRTYLPKICEKLNVKTTLIYQIAKGIKPTPRCPFAKGEYAFTRNSTMSLDFFRLLPIEGFVWKLRSSFHEKKGLKRMKRLACVQSDVAVFKVRATS